MDGKDPDYHLHKTYWTQLESLGYEDADDLHALSVAVNWPHRPQDMDFLLTLGQGFIARDTIHRPLGAGMFFEYGADSAMIGMMMTHPKLQAGGLGREVLTAIETRLDGRHCRLNATKSAWRLYHAAGFQESGRVVQYQGIANAGPETSLHAGLRPARADDLAAIEALDASVFGTLRRAVIANLWQASRVHVIERDGAIAGFAMCRPFGRGHVIGPMVASDTQDAQALAGVFVQQNTKRFLRLDADARHADLGAFLNSVGLESYDSVVPMTKGAPFGPEAATDHIYALASQALG